MKSRRFKKENKKYLGKVAISLIIVAVIVVSSFVTVMANTIPYTVVDGENTYSFSLMTSELDDVLAKAAEEGMHPLEVNDKIHQDGGKIVVDRGFSVFIERGTEYSTLIAFKGEKLEDVLARAGIEILATDIVKPAADTIISENINVVVTPNIDVTVKDGATTKVVTTQGGTVGDALAKLKIKLAEDDIVSPAIHIDLTQGMTIEVKRAMNVTINNGGSKSTLKTQAATVADVLKELKITINDNDTVSPALKTPLKDKLVVSIGRVTLKEVTETEVIEFETEYVDDSSIEEGETKTKTQGKEGSKELIYEETYLNGELSSRDVISEKVIAEPVNEVILRGTMEKTLTPEPTPEPETPEEPEETPDEDNGPAEDSANTFTDYNGDVISYSSVMSGECTAYSDPGGITSLGGATQVGVVAVNPDVIPYGTKMYITSGSVVYGYAVAGDTGGALLSNRVLVDLYYDTEEECYNFGRRDMTVYLLS